MKKGSSRFVFFLFGYAVKIPRLDFYKSFLWGLLANMQEVEFYTTKDERLCPIFFHLPFGFLIIMPKCIELSSDEKIVYNKDFLTNFCCEKSKMTIPAEIKFDSFGWYKGRLVAIDYG